MEPFTVHEGIALPLARADVDTDQIIPKEFLKRVQRAGFGRYLFYDWRFDQSGPPRADFVLNRAVFAGASILVTGRNFGCGSSREHAAWSLRDYGFRAVIAPSFADIFRHNADQNGIVTVELDETVVDDLLARAETSAPHRVTVDLERLSVRDENGFQAEFEMDPFRRTCLMEGLDRIGLTLRHADAISAFEAARAR